MKLNSLFFISVLCTFQVSYVPISTANQWTTIQNISTKDKIREFRQQQWTGITIECQEIGIIPLSINAQQANEAIRKSILGDQLIYPLRVAHSNSTTIQVQKTSLEPLGIKELANRKKFLRIWLHSKQHKEPYFLEKIIHNRNALLVITKYSEKPRNGHNDLELIGVLNQIADIAEFNTTIARFALAQRTTTSAIK